MDLIAAELLQKVREQKKTRDEGKSLPRSFGDRSNPGRQLLEHYERTLELLDVDYKVFVQQNKVAHPDTKKTLLAIQEKVETVVELFDIFNQ